MPLHLINVTIDNCGTGISAPHDADIRANGLAITNTNQAIEIKLPQSLREQLGLPQNTPPEYITEALQMMIETKNKSQEERLHIFNTTRLANFLGIGADLVTIGTAFMKGVGA